MSGRDLILSLSKVLISAAWADGAIDHAEINSLKDLLFGLEEMTSIDWAELEIYMANPIEPDEHERLLEDLRRNLMSREDKDLVFQMLERILLADGEITEEERQLSQQIESSLQDAGTGLISQFGRLLQGPLSRRDAHARVGPNREEYLDDFLRNRIYYHLRRMSDSGELMLEMPEAELRKLSLAGGLLARIASVDREITEEELQSIVTMLNEKWDLDNAAAESVVRLALSELETGLDFFRLSREFFEATDREERLHFVELLFQIGYSDGDLSHAETEEIRKVSQGLKLSHREFIAAKMSAKSG